MERASAGFDTNTKAEHEIEGMQADHVRIEQKLDRAADEYERGRQPMKLVALAGVLAIAYAQFYAIWDVIAHQDSASFASRVMWLVVLLLFPVVGSIGYLRFGPGADHWPPWYRSER